MKMALVKDQTELQCNWKERTHDGKWH